VVGRKAAVEREAVVGEENQRRDRIQSKKFLLFCGKKRPPRSSSCQRITGVVGDISTVLVSGWKSGLRDQLGRMDNKGIRRAGEAGTWRVLTYPPRAAVDADCPSCWIDRRLVW